MNVAFPLKVELRAKASSGYTEQNIQDRLQVLADRDTEEARKEMQFLRDLSARREARKNG